MLSRDEILECRKKERVIFHPFDDHKLKGIGYNLTVGPLAWSVNTRKALPIVRQEDRPCFLVEPNDIGLVVTRETIYVGEEIAGTFHSKVDKVSAGFSHISTTLDPNWIGPLLIAISNNRNRTLDLRIFDTFVTLVLYRIPPCSFCRDNNPAARVDILESLGIKLTEEEHKYLWEEWRRVKSHLFEHSKKNIEDSDSHIFLERKLEETRIKQAGWLTSRTRLFWRALSLMPATLLIFLIIRILVKGTAATQDLLFNTFILTVATVGLLLVEVLKQVPRR